MAEMLAGKRILVTGAARGLGRSIAESAAREGARLVITDILDEELQRTAAELTEQGVPVEAYRVDQGDPESITEGFSRIAEGGALDGLVNNAAIATNVGGKTMMEYDLDLWDKVMTVNVRGVWLTTQAAVPLLAQSGNGRVVNVASDTALWGAPRLMAYVASKGAVISMTRSMARELGEQSITANAIAPGLTHCEATEYVPEERYRTYRDGRALKREQQPDDIDGTVLYLLSDWARFVTGQLIPINGGFVSR
ncbi:SDR family oxidoreductase [Saccharospirillum salsuginis]|uniref:3-ketoacyl-ACP reductase n=1 Tax=Saccharospirillum salsuginis TaxID=418750 RepID=A0A918K440_9GAMM|nr:SDR family oxidoreductase [Saccharospirillum salsuginis]GGX45160.1 3-ketoacyl-ACP reductase [Saccharospirillum salsuginis]